MKAIANTLFLCAVIWPSFGQESSTWKDIDSSPSPPPEAETSTTCHRDNYRDFLWDSQKIDVLVAKTGRGCNLYEADLRGTDLTRADLYLADLEWAQLDGALLVNANLVDANLANASLVGANLTRADLLRANFEGANLTRAILPAGFVFGPPAAPTLGQKNTTCGRKIWPWNWFRRCEN